MHIILFFVLLPFLLLGRLLRLIRADVACLPEGHPEMLKAVQDAQQSLQEFRCRLQSPQTGMSDFAVKARFPVAGGSEHCWVNDLRLDGSSFHGKLANHPQKIEGLVLGSEVTLSPDVITDWAYSQNGYFHGHFTTKVLLPRMSKQIRRQVEMIYGWPETARSEPASPAETDYEEAGYEANSGKETNCEQNSSPSA